MTVDTVAELAVDTDVVAVDGLSKTFAGPPEVTALRPASFRIRRGEYVAITGASGSGKTTLLSLLGLLDTPTTGSYRLDGVDVAGLDDRARSGVRATRIGFVFQAFHLIGSRTVLENVELGLVYQATPRRERRRRTLDVIEQVGLGHRCYALCSTLSGGEKQRVAIARSLVREPALVLCDEPTGNLDTATTGQILALLDDVHRRGLTIVVITHDPSIAAGAQRRLTITDGTVTEPDQPPDVETASHPMGTSTPTGESGSAGRSRMRLVDTFTEAAAALTRRPARTLLTALGTILGVAAFVTTTGLAQTARAQVSSRFDALRATEVRIQDANPDGTNPFPADTEARLQRLNGVNHAGVSFPVPDTGGLQPRNTATRPVETAQPIPVIAATPGAIWAALPTVDSGRIYDDWHETRGENVAVLGRVAADQLGITRIDQQPAIFIADTAYTVIGILADIRRNPDLLLSITIPTTTANELADTRNSQPEVLIDTAPGAAQQIGRQAPLALRPQQPERLQALVPPDPRNLRNQVESDVQSLFYALAGLAVLIGTIAITNATLLATVERRPEIGLRRALGATRHHITRQITLEAALTGTLAGILGTFIGVTTVTIAALARTWTPTIDPRVLLAAPAIGTLTGALAGVVPARRAASTPPAETLRT